MTAILPTLLEEFYEKLTFTRNNVLRETLLPEAENMVKVVVGMRRVGKTCFVFQKINALIEEKKIPIQSILYINFEDDRLLPMDHKEMGKLIDAFYTLFPENHTRQCYLILDEVQNISNWELVVRRLFDSKNVQIYLTGSSAKLLSKEIATALRGRSIETEIWPYSFSEYQKAHQIDSPKPPFGKKTVDIMRQHLLDYLQCGGFPAVQAFSSVEHLETLQTYVETVIFRDIVERHKVTNIALLKYLINFLMKNVAAPFSINKFYNDIKSQGYKVGKDTLYNYLDYVQDAYLLFTVSHFTESVREIQTIPKKTYIIDTGILLANTFNLSSNYGKLFENLVYLDLRRQNNEVFYYKTLEGYEIDFVVKPRQAEMYLMQVVWDLEDEQTRQREERALREAERELGIKGKILDFSRYLKEGV